MKTVLTQLCGRRRTLVLLSLVVLVASTAAWAYWAAQSSGHASGKVGELAAPSITSATPGGGTVALTWTAVTAPGTGTVSYYVRRDGGAASTACPSSSAPGTQTSCTDTGVPTGGHSYTVTAVWRSWTAKSESASALVSSGAATHFVLTPATTTPTAGGADNLTITAKDAANNTVTGYSGAKSLTFSGANMIGSSHPLVTSSIGTAIAFGSPEPINFSSGVASVSGQGNGVMTLYKAEAANIKVTDGSIESSGVSVTVSAAAAASFALATPSAQTAGSAFSEPIVAKDAYGNTATSYTGPKTLSFTGPSSSPGGEAAKYPGSVSFSSGSANASITLFDADEETTLTATQGAITGSSGEFTVNPLSAASFALAAPGAQIAGVGFSEAITARDTYGNTATSYNTTKTVTFTGPSNSPNGKAPTSSASVNFSFGVGSASITLYDAQTTTLSATQSTLKGTSASFTVAAAAASTFTLPTPSTQTAGTAFDVTLTAKDAYGNTASGYEGAKVIAFGEPNESPGGKAPKYPASVNFTSGVGTASITLYDAQTTKLSGSDGSIAGTTGNFTVNAKGTTMQFGVSVPANVTAGTAFNATITAEDEYANTTTSYTSNKTMSFSGPAESPSNKSPSYDSSVFFSAGKATATTTLYDAQTTKLKVTQGSIAGESESFTVAPASLNSLSVSTPGAQTVGVAFNLTIIGKDAFGNAVSGAQALTFSGPASAPDTTSPTYPSSVTFSEGEGKASVTLPDAQTTTITAARGSIKGTSGAFTVNPGPAAELALVAADETPTAGVADNLTITAKDSFGNTATSYTGSRSLIFGGASTLGANHPTVSSATGTSVSFGTATALNFSSGVAKALGSSNGAMTLYKAETAEITVADNSNSSINNGSGLPLVVGPGALTISVTNPGTQTAGTAFNLAISAKDSFGNALSGAQALTFTGPASSPSEKAPSYPSSVTFSAGLGTAPVTLYAASATTNITVSQGAVNGSSGNFAVNAGAAAKLAWSSVAGSAGAAEGLCLFTCTWSGIGKSHTWTAKVSVTDANGNIVSNIGSGHTVTWTGGPNTGSLAPSSLALPSSGTATTSSSVTYTSSSSNFWSSDTFTAHSSPYGDATILLKK